MNKTISERKKELKERNEDTIIISFLKLVDKFL